jgi:YfiR/HmsC-like
MVPRPLALLLALVSTAPAARPAAQGQSEYRLKAAFVYQFPHFVDWPSEAWKGTRRVEICVLKPDPFGADLQQLVDGESLSGRPLEVRAVDPGEPIDTCHVLFVTMRADGAGAALLKQAASRPILTVGDSPRFLEEGGIILLKLVHNRVRFEISIPAAKRAGLRISTQLLSLAQAVRGAP